MTIVNDHALRLKMSAAVRKQHSNSERELAESLARKSGMTLGEWLNHMILKNNDTEPHNYAVSEKSTFDKSYDLPDDYVVGAGVFKAKCLSLLDAVAQTRKPLTITKNGKPIAQLMPMPPEGNLFGALAGSVKYEDDIVAPLDNDWSAAR